MIHAAEKTAIEEQQLRLESEAAAVKIVTLHRAKGLEYDLVFCPLLWYESPKFLTPSIVCYQQGQLVTDLGSDTFEQHQQLAAQEQLAEELRLFYVAVTRAKYACYLIWANVGSKNNPNSSAMAYLFEFSEANFASQQAKLQQFKTEQPQIFDYQLITELSSIQSNYQTPNISLDFQLRHRKHTIYSDWKISSYTALANHSTPEIAPLVLDKTAEMDEKSQALETVLALPKGAHSGNVIHYLLEFNSFSKLADADYDFSHQRDQSCLRFGLKLAQPELINQLLRVIVNTPLAIEDTQFCLKNIHSWQCIKEMPFYLAIKSFTIQQINAILADCPDFRALTAQSLSGYLTGFIDLICEYQGRYYLIDYKTNTLENYQTETLIQAMREHHYGLQYWLYTVVLNDYLHQRLPNYNYHQHFGGVRYLFVRGMQAEIPMSGVYAVYPCWKKLQALRQIFNYRA
jgi:exodeoxyribonuclease V beta subunit